MRQRIEVLLEAKGTFSPRGLFEFLLDRIRAEEQLPISDAYSSIACQVPALAADSSPSNSRHNWALRLKTVVVICQQRHNALSPLDAELANLYSELSKEIYSYPLDWDVSFVKSSVTPVQYSILETICAEFRSNAKNGLMLYN